MRALQEAAGVAKRTTVHASGSREAYEAFATTIAQRDPVTMLDLLRIKDGVPVPLEEVEPEEFILWRFMVPGMSEGALSEPAHRSIARAMNVLHRYCRRRFHRAGVAPPDGIGPVANSGEGGFDKTRIGRADGNRSVQYAGARFTITPMTAARAAEAEVKFAQGAKPGKGGQLPGRKVSPRIAHQRGCEPGFELVSPPVNHNLYSIEDVKLMIESWRHLNPAVSCALKYVATDGVEMVCMGGVNAGANRLHLSDGSGGTGAAKRSDQKHAGVPAAAVLPVVHDMLVEEGVRNLVELSVDGGVQTGEQALKLALLGADRIGFGTTVLISIGCSMLRQCHLAGPQPGDATGTRRLGCTTGVATQDPVLVARFGGEWRHVTRYLRHVAGEIRALMAAMGVRHLADIVGRRDLLERREDLHGKAALVDVGHLVGAPPRRVQERHLRRQGQLHQPPPRVREDEAADRAIHGEVVEISQRLTNVDRAVGIPAAGAIARRFGDAGLPAGRLVMRHRGAAGHFYAAYTLGGMEFRMRGLVADSCFTAAYGGKVVIVPDQDEAATPGLTLVGNTFAYGARCGTAFIAGRAGNRCGVCLRKSHEGQGPRIVVEGVGANAFQYMTGGTVLVLGPTGFNLGAGMTGGVVYVLDHNPDMLNREYVTTSPLDEQDVAAVSMLLQQHVLETDSPLGQALAAAFESRTVRQGDHAPSPRTVRGGPTSDCACVPLAWVGRVRRTRRQGPAAIASSSPPAASARRPDGPTSLGLRQHPPRHPHGFDPARVPDVLQRVGLEDHEVGVTTGAKLPDLPFGADARRRVARGGEQRLPRRQAGLDQPLELEVFEVALETSGRPGIGAERETDAAIGEDLGVLHGDRERSLVLARLAAVAHTRLTGGVLELPEKGRVDGAGEEWVVEERRAAFVDERRHLAHQRRAVADVVDLQQVGEGRIHHLIAHRVRQVVHAALHEVPRILEIEDVRRDLQTVPM